MVVGPVGPATILLLEMFSKLDGVQILQDSNPTCMDARGLKDTDLVEGTRRSSLNEMTEWTLWADKVLVF